MKLNKNDKKKTEKGNFKDVRPSEEEMRCLLENYQNGLYSDAEKLARSITQEFPNHQFAWKVLGALLRNTGRVSESLVPSKKAVKLSPQDIFAHLNLGIILKELGKLDDAEASYRQAIALKPNYAEAHNNLGNTLEELGRLVDTEASYRQAIALKPNYAEAHNNLGNILRESRKYEEAIHHFDLVNNDFAAALSLECIYMSANYIEFDKRLNSLSASDNMNLRVAAVSSFVAHQMKKKDPYPFCTNPLDFITINNLADYDLYSNTLLEEIIKEADGYQLTWEGRTTKFGFQGSPYVFENPRKTISLLEKIIQQAVDTYYDTFKSESNLFIKSWPRKYKLVGWYNRLVKNGHHTSHIHQTGWLSGVIYLKTINLSDNDEGAIEFGLHGYDLPITDEEYPRKIHRPKRGDIILFPSSLFHRTIPFTTDSERCVIAFDLKAV